MKTRTDVHSIKNLDPAARNGTAPDGGVFRMLRGRTVTFRASMERSRDDQCFGFFKRPTRAAIVQ